MARPIDVILDSAKESVVFTAIAAVVAVPFFWLARTSYLDGVGFVLLLEACGLMLLGGVMEFTSTGVVRRFVSMLSRSVTMEPGEMKRQMSGAVLYTVTGVVLFLESLAIALFLLI